jgi:hypothetical protein
VLSDEQNPKSGFKELRIQGFEGLFLITFIGTTSGSIYNEKREGFFFTLLAISTSSIKMDIYREIDLVMLKISAFHYSLTMVVVKSFSLKRKYTICRYAK